MTEEIKLPKLFERLKHDKNIFRTYLYARGIHKKWISGEYTSSDKRSIVLEQMVTKKDSNTFRIDATATDKGFSGTYHSGNHTLPVTLER